MKRVCNFAIRGVLAASLFLIMTSGEVADVVEYCSVFGQDVTFSGLVETSTGGDGPMYGQPSADGDTLVAMGLGFLTQSAGGGVQLVDGRLQMTVTAADGFMFNEINVNSLGSFFGLGVDAMSIANSFAMVEADGQVFTDGMIVNQSGTNQAGWQGDYTISFPDTDEVTLTLNTQLLTASGAGSAAFIEASSIRISVNAFAVAVPEPSTVWWMAIAMLAVNRRRHRSVDQA